jgi:DNA-binding IclR family transcriptional regulator
MKSSWSLLSCAAACLAAWSCATPVEEGLQPFDAPSVESAGASDPAIASAVDAAVAVARALGFHYDASQSESGLVNVTAPVHGEPVWLTLRFIAQEGALTVACAMSQSAGAALQDAGRQVEAQFFDHLDAETQARGLGIVAHLGTEP